VGVPDDAGSANPDSAFRFDAASGAYIFNLKTTGLQTGTYALSFTATGDPTTHAVTFQIR
jgi:endoglucanase Acf2